MSANNKNKETTDKRKKGIDLFLSQYELKILMRIFLISMGILLGLIEATFFLIIILVLDRVLGWKIIEVFTISSAILLLLYFILHYKFLNIRSEMFAQWSNEVNEKLKKGADVEDVNK